MNDNQDLLEKSFKSADTAIEYLEKHADDNLEITVTHLGKTRTLTQNRCIHVYCEMLALALNAQGSYREVRFKALGLEEIVMPWSGELVKHNIWHPIQYSMYPHAVNKNGEPSTTKLNTTEVGEVYKIISMNVAQSRGINIEWPSLRG